MRVAMFVVLGFVAGCAARPEPPMVGYDLDENGCNRATGASWCQATRSCEIPWNFARAHGLPTDRKSFDAYCDQPAQ